MGISKTQGIEPTVVVRKVNHTYHGSKFNALLGKERDDVEVLHDINFAAYQGESIGVLGRNGSGKSTLLRLIAGNEKPTTGEVFVSSPPALLGVSAALQPDLNAWENARLGLLAMGLTPERVEELLEDVVLWSALGTAAARPMKTYSSGMQARLKFSIATAIPREILLVDEALSTGDSTFANRAKRRVRDFIQAAGTVFVVSHAPGQIEEYCQRCLWIHEGRIIADGPTKWVSRCYKKWSQYASADRPDLEASLLEQMAERYERPRFVMVSEAERLLGSLRT
ncbi:ABC transporter ATP-binding protein [Corynebacterium hesseae]|uniref:ABC transporter ATP-binding protein n=1 Tax=Corynebacterium hesseae TaxID=2913502 RepID=UPI0022B9EAAD|nr:ABC transporter ATP-binding protein [Corynebacterium hesseae]MCZ9298684.1 ABC transporter ATP-binding protein [Corynebacterium hesseae]